MKDDIDIALDAFLYTWINAASRDNIDIHIDSCDGSHVEVVANRWGILAMAAQLLKMARSDRQLTEVTLDEASLALPGSHPIVIQVR